MPDLRAVLLDAGGTLIHPDRDFILRSLADQGIVADDAAYDAAARRARDAVRDILRSGTPGNDGSRSRAWFVTLLTTLGLPPRDLEAFGGRIRDRHAAGLLWSRVEPGTVETLDALAGAGLRLAVISNADGTVAELLATAGLADRFELIVDSGRVGIEKPDPRIFRIAADGLGIAPAEAAYVGDLYEVDVLGARAAGMAAVLVTDEPREDVRCIARIAELPAALGLTPAGPRMEP